MKNCIGNFNVDNNNIFLQLQLGDPAFVWDLVFNKSRKYGKLNNNI